MAFREVPAPDADQFIEPPHELIMTSVVLPAPNLFLEEGVFWRKKLPELKSDVHRQVAEHTIGVMRNLVIGRTAIDEGGYHEKFTPEQMGVWYVEALHKTAQARLIRELIELPTYYEEPQASSIAEVNDALDVSDEDILRSGIHFREGRFRELLDVTPPAKSETKWYEGEAIFLRADRPANPTDKLREKWLEQFNTRFKGSQFISVVPRLKTSFWPIV